MGQLTRRRAVDSTAPKSGTQAVHVGYFSSIDGWGGSEAYLLSVMRGARDAGHAATLFGLRGTRLLAAAEADGIRCVAWGETCAPPPARPASGGGRSGGRAERRGLKNTALACAPPALKLLAGNARELARLRRLFRAHPLDLVHANVNGYEMAGLACRLAGIPCLGTCHNMFIRQADPLRRWLVKWTLRAYTRVVCVAPRARDAWQEATGIASDRISAIWNGVDVERFSPAGRRCRASPDEPFRLVSVGRLDPVKGFEYLVEALRLAADPRLRLEIVGEGPSLDALRRQAARAGVESQVVFAGHVDEPETRLREADAFALVSVRHEACPLVVPEAMACGLPVVTSDFGALPDMNPDGVTGLVVPARDAAAAAAAIRRLADDPAAARRMGAAGRERAVATFSRQGMIAQLLEIYAETQAS
jgi:glycosyltransferase involved in cell wall biosynthesis